MISRTIEYLRTRFTKKDDMHESPGAAPPSPRSIINAASLGLDVDDLVLSVMLQCINGLLEENIKYRADIADLKQAMTDTKAQLAELVIWRDACLPLHPPPLVRQSGFMVERGVGGG